MSSPASYSGQYLDPVSARYRRRTSRPLGSHLTS